MNIHKNARLTPHGREILVSRLERGEHPIDVACAMGVSTSTIYKWWRRFRAEGISGLLDRSSRPTVSPNKTPGHLEDKIISLRKARRIFSRIAIEVGVSRATVARILARHGLNRWRDLEPAQPVHRYEHETPGDMIHIDIKKLARFSDVGHRITGDRTGQNTKARRCGWEFIHVCVDDHSRLAFADIMIDEKKETAVAFLDAVVIWYKALNISITRVMTDNGACYRSNAFRDACKRYGMKHIFTKPYTPQTNGKAERFIQSAIREWAYARAYKNSEQRGQDLPKWLHHYNWHRPHAGIKGKAPINRSGLDVNNLMRLHN